MEFTFRVGSSLAYKYENWLKVTGSDEHTSLKYHCINYERERFYSVRPLSVFQ